jgi:hypothetical protein
MDFRFDSRQGIFFFFRTSRPALGPPLSPIQWLLGVKRSNGETGAEAKNGWRYTATQPYVLIVFYLRFLRMEISQPR